MTDTRIIGFRGKKGVGKNFVSDLVAQMLTEQGFTVEAGALADPIKRFLCDNLEIEYNWCYGTDAEKNTLTRYDWSLMFDDIRADNGKHSGAMTAREIMQVFGTDICRRVFGKDIWTGAMRRRINRSSADFFLITDIRFGNEVEMVRHEWGGRIWQVMGPQRGEEHTKKDMHPSEAQVDLDVKVDVKIDNGLDKTVDDLRRQISQYIPQPSA